MTPVSGKVQLHYDEIAGVYDKRYDENRGRFYYTHITRHIMEGFVNEGRLLDLGCGTGLFLQRYLEHGGSGTGLDISRGMLEKASCRCPSSRFIIGTAEALPFRDRSFDAVSSILSFSYFKEPEETLSEVYRVLAPGGSIGVCTLGRNIFTRGLPAIYQISEVMNIKKACHGAFGERYYSVGEMETMLSDAGFTDVAVRRCSFAHYDLADPIFGLAQKIEPFVEQKIPYLAYNICAKGKKPVQS
ncbi:MAG TPA: methyltransferase domain-containing protein [Methanoregulaceae archaeon]|nr:methyltransferase domain-containing protein [Methanoregulaceae archaeon]